MVIIYREGQKVLGGVLNRIVILLCALGLLFYEVPIENAILPMIIAISISGFLEYFENHRLSISLYLFYFVLSLLFPYYVLLLPLISYDLLRTKREILLFSAILPYALHFDSISNGAIPIIVTLWIVAYLLKIKADKEKKLKHDYITQRDTLTELSNTLEQKVDMLISRQDEEIKIATLNERNRIAREIHDNVGHLLSSSILQLSAVIAVTKDEEVKKRLDTVRETLDGGMISIRKSIHNLHDDSVDLGAEINRLLSDFTFCKAILTYETNSKMSAKMKYSIIAIIKEAMSNVIKHSNATEMHIKLFEHPSFYQLIIYDNGTKKTDIKASLGMGLENIKQRVTSLSGNVNFDNQNGFKIFISIMKSETEV